MEKNSTPAIAIVISILMIALYAFITYAQIDTWQMTRKVKRKLNA